MLSLQGTAALPMEPTHKKLVQIAFDETVNAKPYEQTSQCFRERSPVKVK